MVASALSSLLMAALGLGSKLRLVVPWESIPVNQFRGI